MPASWRRLEKATATDKEREAATALLCSSFSGDGESAASREGGSHGNREGSPLSSTALPFSVGVGVGVGFVCLLTGGVGLPLPNNFF